MPSIRLLSMVYEMTKSKHFTWIPWQLRVTARQYQEAVEARSHKAARTGRKRMNPAFLIHMATAYIKASAKGHEANSVSFFVLEIKRNLCLFCVLFFRPLISRNIWLKGPFCRSQSSVIAQQAAYRIIHKTIHQGQSILASSTLAYWILSGIDPGTNNDLNYHRVPVSGDRRLGQWASPHPPARSVGFNRRVIPFSAQTCATGSCLTCTIRSGICGIFVCPDAMPPSCRGSFLFPYLSPFFGAARLCAAYGAGLLAGRAALCGRLAGCAARGCLVVLGRSMSSKCISMRPCVSSWNASSIDHLRCSRSTIVPQIWRSACKSSEVVTVRSERAGFG